MIFRHAFQLGSSALCTPAEMTTGEVHRQRGSDSAGDTVDSMKPAVFEDSAIDLFLHETLMGRIVYRGNMLKRKNGDDGGSNTQAFLL